MIHTRTIHEYLRRKPAELEAKSGKADTIMRRIEPGDLTAIVNIMDGAKPSKHNRLGEIDFEAQLFTNERQEKIDWLFWGVVEGDYLSLSLRKMTAMRIISGEMVNLRQNALHFGVTARAASFSTKQC